MKPIAMILALALFFFTILLSACSQESTAPMISPKPALDAAKKSAGLGNLNAGQRIYQDSCSSCHDSGMAGAPKLGDKKAWASRMQYGLEHLVQMAISGIGQMPAKGGNMKLGDHEIKLAVEYMVKKGQ
jgi:cytochrome c5